MSLPFICCITPCESQKYLDRAIACYLAQTYPEDSRDMVVLDNSWHGLDVPEGITRVQWLENGRRKTVGGLRNAVIAIAQIADLIAHFDYDDWSACTRLEEQVDFMDQSGCDVTGYYDMPFYDETTDKVYFYNSANQHYALGTSLMYKRSVWERVPFPDQTPEDTTWQNQVGRERILSRSSLVEGDPGMIQTVHGKNASARITVGRFEPASKELEAKVRAILGKS